MKALNFAENIVMNVQDLAEYIITKCTVDNRPITNLQLQKILYFIQVEFLQNFNQPAFNEEIEAWKFGPVVPEVYYRYSGYVGLPLYDDSEVELTYPSNYSDRVDRIITEKREISPWALVEESHNRNRSWYEVYQNGFGDKTEIPKDLIAIKG